MKKIIFALLFIFFSSCSDDTSNNTPEFQALLNGDTEWITDDFNATISNDQLTIFGINGLGSINLNVYSPEIGEFNFYGNSSSSAIFQDDSLQYSTENFVPGSIGFNKMEYRSKYPAPLVQRIPNINAPNTNIAQNLLLKRK